MSVRLAALDLQTSVACHISSVVALMVYWISHATSIQAGAGFRDVR